MSRMVLDVSMSLDGFTTGPNVREEAPLGDGGQRLHEWMTGNGPDGGVDTGVQREVDSAAGAHRGGDRDPPALPRREALTPLRSPTSRTPLTWPSPWPRAVIGHAGKLRVS